MKTEYHEMEKFKYEPDLSIDFLDQIQNGLFRVFFREFIANQDYTIFVEDFFDYKQVKTKGRAWYLVFKARIVGGWETLGFKESPAVELFIPLLTLKQTMLKHRYQPNMTRGFVWTFCRRSTNQALIDTIYFEGVGEKYD